MNTPTITLKSGVRVMTRPVLTEDLPLTHQGVQPPGQPAVNMTFDQCTEIAAEMGGRLPTEEEWLEVFDKKPYSGGILEWTSTEVEDVRVVRGGSWGVNAGLCRAAFRDGSLPFFRYDDLGFRVAFDK